MYKKLRIAIAQAEAAKANPEANEQKLIQWVKEAAAKGANMICFPELYYSAYDISADELRECAIDQNDPFFEKLKTLARENDINILISYPEKNGNDKPYISYAFIDSYGNWAGNHRKTYLWLEENDKATPGEPVYEVIDTPFGRIGLLICYEIEFPEPARLLTLKGAEIIISTMAWDTIPNLHKYVSSIGILNQVYAVAINGFAPYNEKHRGGSCIADQRGKLVYTLDEGVEAMGIYEIDLEENNRRNEAPHKTDLIIDTLRQLSEIKQWKF
ncbi:MAG: carbon-nitrogen hydrolase family protein [Bacillota bacterium]|nr:carbon-nitrogen hydrolase family protein [Bacillota bacterium]